MDYKSSAKEMSRLLDCSKLHELGCIRCLPVNLVKFFLLSTRVKNSSCFGWPQVSFNLAMAVAFLFSFSVGPDSGKHLSSQL